MNNYNEHELEMTIIELLKEKGYTYIDSDDYWVENRKLNDFIIEEDLRDSLERINKGVSRSIFDEIVNKVKYLEALSFIDKNKIFHNYLIDGITVEDYNSASNPLIKLIDFDNAENNIFKVANQIKFNDGRETRIPDILIYINGLPLILFELKSIEQRKDATIEQAFEQIGGSSTNDGYRYDIPTIFNYNAFCIISDGANNRIGTITSTFERYSEWKSVNGEMGYDSNNTHKLDIMIDGVFTKERLLDILKNNIFFMEKYKEEPIKIISQYHQYFGVRKAEQSIKKHLRPNGDGKAGIIWHTQGSGKSFSMVMLTHRLMKDPMLNNPTIIVLTDRNDLDDQLYTTFSNAKEYLRNTPVKITSRKDLLEKIEQTKENGIFFATLQKIDKDNIVPNNRNNIIVISDEAHRSHYGLNEKIKMVKNDSNEYDLRATYGYEKYLRDALPNATFIGFTGTPVQNKDKDTTAIFGDIIDTYDMTQSIEDGSTVKLFYESRLAKVWLDDNKLKEIDQYYEDLQDEGVQTDLIEMSKSSMSRMEVLLGDESRLKLLANDIITHYESRKGILNDKAMIVCMSRKIAYNLYNLILGIRPNYKDIMQLIVTESNKDDELMRNALMSKKERDKIAEDFKNKNGKTKIVIVVDMWLTGFDVQDLDVMYLDKPMKEHTLMQAIARVNRVFPGKESGLIVDYVGISKYLDEALNTYTKRDRETNLTDIRNTAYMLIKENLSILDEWFYKINVDGFKTDNELQKYRLIQEGTDFVLENDKRKDEYLSITKIIKGAYVMALGMITTEEKNKISYYLGVRHFIMKLDYSKNPVSLTKVNEKVAELLAEAIKGDEVKVLTKIGEDDGVTIWDLLKKEKIEELRKSNPPHVFIKLIDRLLTEAIKETRKNNLVKSKEYSERLRNLLSKYNDRSDDGFDVEMTIVGLMAFSEDILSDEEEAAKNNLKGRERAFYDALTADDKAKLLMEDETLKLIASKLKNIVEEYATVDWSKKKSTQAKMRVQIKRLLNEYGYPPEYNEEATKRVIDQAEFMM
jgi:type I site-specific deoxyribonuclease, hsdR family